MNASIAIQILPHMPDKAETVRVVDEVIAYIASTGLSYYVGPFETTVEGEDYDQLMEIVANCAKVAVKAGSEQVSAYVKISYKPSGDILPIHEKVDKHHK
jgi:uncharacterized protein YqgV (UPF0045/DUF77 family)